MFVDSLASTTSARLVAVSTADTIESAALAFSDIGIGLLVVCDEIGTAVGVLSKYDLVRHIAGAGPVGAPLAAAMSWNIVHCAPGDDLYATWQSMQARHLQNLPVIGADGKPQGVLDIRDALRALLEEERFEERELIDYISGVGYR